MVASVSLLVSIEWITGLTYASSSSVTRYVRSGAIFRGTYSLIVALPYFLLWKTYKKELFSFADLQDEVMPSGK
jgi:hypothetical protein